MKWGRHDRYNSETAITRFMSKVQKQPDGCWIWTGAKGSHKRYGILSLAGKCWLAHRAAWLLFNGHDPGDKVVCHKCDNGFCVNPDHLFIGEQADNIRDMESKNRARHPSCEKHGRAKLTLDQVKEIRQKLEAGASLRVLAKAYGVSKPSIQRIKHNKGWLTT